MSALAGLLSGVLNTLRDINAGIKTLIAVNKTQTINVSCNCTPPPKPIPQRVKSGRVGIPKGQTVSAILFKGVIGTKASAGDVKKNVFVVTVEGFQPYEVIVDQPQPVTNPDGTPNLAQCDLVIPKGVTFHVYDYDIDGDGNRSSPSTAFEGVATDTTAGSKDGSVTLPPGQTVDDSQLPPMTPVAPPQ